jgi:hypothetical protein
MLGGIGPYYAYDAGVVNQLKFFSFVHLLPWLEAQRSTNSAFEEIRLN